MRKLLYTIHVAQFTNFIILLFSKRRKGSAYFNLYRHGYLDRWQGEYLWKNKRC